MITFTLKDRIKIRENYKKWKSKSDPYKYGNWDFFLNNCSEGILLTLKETFYE